ncbi:MAG TPA: N-acetyl sugar amidotransferase [Anaerolineae bacterium]|nr:N-acetyl sugar amidotransferase [Anaerolineae bacterium]
MRYCKKCVQPDTRPGIVFDSEGVCMACHTAADQNIDWAAREGELRDIAGWAKSQGAQWDCAIGVSGGKDSTFQALYARDCLGLRALLVNCTPDPITDVGVANKENLYSLGFDMIQIRPNPDILRTLVRRAFEDYGNLVKPTEYPLFASTWQVAARWQIPLVIQGENPAETLGIGGGLSVGGDALDIRHHNTIAGGARGLVGNGVTMRDLAFYEIPPAEEIERAGIRSVWLGHYAMEWSRTLNTTFSVARGLRGRPMHNPAHAGRLSEYGSVDSDFQIVNQMLKYYKFGFGFVTDEVCYSIREGAMTREEAIDLVKKYDGRCDAVYMLQFCDYIGYTLPRFWNVVDRWVNKALFERRGNCWAPKFTVGEDFDE